MTTNDTVDIEELIPLQELPRHLPKPGGKKIHVSQPYRWAKRGLDGVRLRTVKVGSVMYTHKDWIWEFLNRDNKPHERRMTSRQRERELDRVDAELAAKGIL